VYSRRELIGEGLVNPAAPFHRAVLGNGTTVIVKPNNRFPVVAMDCWVKTGTINEEFRLNGISHFYEHMFFKGTEKHPVGELDALVKEMGGYNNAATSNEYTHYYVVLPGELNERALELLADALYNDHFRPEDADRERMVVKEEINRSEDDPATKLYTTLFEQCFEGLPYAMPILGKKESLDRIGPDELRTYHNAFYVPRNVTVVISGSVDPDHAFSAVDRHYGSVPEGRSTGWTEIGPLERNSPKEMIIPKDVKQVYCALGFRTMGFLTDRPHIVALDVAASLLGEGRSSRMHQELVEKKKLAISISTWNWDMRMAGVLWVDAVLRPDRIEDAKQAIFEELDRFLDDGATEWELGKVKSMIRADQRYDLESSASVAGLLGFYQTDFDDAGHALTYLDMVDAVDRDVLRKTFAEIYDPESCVKILIVPAGEY
jgi:zinc protease